MMTDYAEDMKRKLEAKLKVILCVPTRKRPHPECYKSLEKSEQAIKDAGFEYGIVTEVENPYISGARATMLKKGLRADGDIFVFIDDDMSWEPEALVRLIKTEPEVVGGTYRARDDSEENYMGRILQDESGKPTSWRPDGLIECSCLPAGFLKVTKEAVDKFMKGYPELCYGPGYNQAVDLFNHGAHKGLWWGEDYAFCRRWRDIGGKIWLLPDIDLDHNCWEPMGKVYKGNFHEFMLRQPGGILNPDRKEEADRYFGRA
jgi:glycosyltransferase involved in cell wall biosynthesis